MSFGDLMKKSPTFGEEIVISGFWEQNKYVHLVSVYRSGNPSSVVNYGLEKCTLVATEAFVQHGDSFPRKLYGVVSASFFLLHLVGDC